MIFDERRNRSIVTAVFNNRYYDFLHITFSFRFVSLKTISTTMKKYKRVYPFALVCNSLRETRENNYKRFTQYSRA